MQNFQAQIKRNRKWIWLDNFSLSIVFNAQYLSTILYIYTGQSSFALVMFCAGILFSLSVVFQKKCQISRNMFFLLVLILIYYIGTTIFQSGKSSVSLIEIITMCIIPIIVGSMFEGDYRSVLKISMLMLCFSIPIFNQLFAKGNMGTSYDAVGMGTSYAVLPTIMSGVAFGIMYWKQSDRLEKILTVISFLYLPSFIIMSYRGALMAALVVIVLLVLFRKNDTNKKVLVSVIGVLILALIALQNLTEILMLLSNLLEKFDIRIAFIQKTLYLGENFMHGRIEIYNAALDGFFESPFWGHGIATFEYYTGYVFPHNFVLQLLYDGGVFLFVPITLFIIYGFKSMFKYIRFNDKAMFSLMILSAGISLTRMMVSAEMWRVILFFLFLGMATNLSSIRPMKITLDN